MFSDLINITLSWLALSSLALLTIPVLSLTMKHFMPDSGWGFARVSGWLAVATPIWFLGHLGLPVNTSIGVWTIFFILAGLNFWLFFRRQKEIMISLKKAKPFIIIEEALFAGGFFFLSLMRGFEPNINSLEKFMDMGLIISYLNSPTLPIADMWLSGFTFNYYTFGHFLGAVATQITRQPVSISYNLLLGFILGLMLIESFSLVTFLLKGIKRLPVVLSSGVVGALLVNFGGNTHHIWYFLKNGNFLGYWYPDATRFIYNTIHEFPTYSFVVSDLHAHVWSMVIVLFLIVIIFRWANEVIDQSKAVSTKNYHFLLWAGLMGFIFGLIASTSTWDLMIYGILLGLLGLVILIKIQLASFKNLFVSAVIVGLTTLLASSPWFLNFQSISQGIKIVETRSPAWQLAVLWSGGVFWCLAGLTIIGKKAKVLPTSNHYQVVCLILLAWSLLLLPEIIYFKDIYPSHPRANTMFKLTFQAFILMQLVGAWTIGQVLNQLLIKIQLANKNAQIKARVVLLIFLSLSISYILASLFYAKLAYNGYYGKKYQGLDGLLWLKTQHPDDYAGLEWLKRNVKGRPVILEAVGESYTTFGRISTFSGLTTVIGWPVHEWLWRGSYDIPGQRVEEVRQIYLTPFSDLAQLKLAEYQVEYIFVGDKEREAYSNLDSLKLKNLGKVVFQKNQTFIIKINETQKLNTNPIEWQ